VISKKPALDLIPGEIENALDAAAQSRQPVATVSDAAEKVPGRHKQPQRKRAYKTTGK
jgi:hypothetical protein